MKLSAYAKWAGVSYRTAWEHFRTGKIPGAIKLPTKVIVVPDRVSPKKERTVVYARESSADRRQCLRTQAERVVAFCTANGWAVSEVIQETGSGLNDRRKRLLAVLRERTATRLVVEHQDRLARFGVEYIKTLLESFGCELVIINPIADDQQDIMQDFVDIVTCFCARIYGNRRSKRKTEQLIEKLKADE
jgi:predicted site-specific integrase-resolvase